MFFEWNGRTCNGFDSCIFARNGLEQVCSGNGLEQVYSDVSKNMNGDLAKETLKDFDEFWDNISDRIMISQMVSDSVIIAMLTAVEKHCAERIAAKELEVSNLKKSLQSPMFLMKHEKMRGDLDALKILVLDQFKMVEKEIACPSGILQEKDSENWVNVDKMLQCLKTTLDTVWEKVDDILLCSDVSFCESQQDIEFLAEVDTEVTQTILRSVQEELEEKFWKQNAQLSVVQNVNWVEKFNDITKLGTELDAIQKSLSMHEADLVSYGSHDLDYLHHKTFDDNDPPGTTLYGDNMTTDANIHDAERYDFQQLNHLKKKELVDYFNDTITKMKRDHESDLHQKTEEYFQLKREYLKVKASLAAHRKDDEFHVLSKRIPEVISKLEDFLLQNARFPALTNNLENIEKMKHRVESLLSENRRLRDCLDGKENEVNHLKHQLSSATSKFLRFSLAEEKTLKLVENLKSAVENSCIEASLSEEIYKSALRQQIAHTRSSSEDLNMEFLITREIYDIFLREAAIPAETANGNKIEDSDIESLMMQGLDALISTEVIRDAGWQLDKLQQQREDDLRLEVEEKEKLKQEILELKRVMEYKEKLVMDFSVSLSKEREQFALASLELINLREEAIWQQTLVNEKNKHLESLKLQHLEALELIEVRKLEMHKLNQKLNQLEMLSTETNRERIKASTRGQEKHDMLSLSKSREETFKKEMEMAVNNFSNTITDFEWRVLGVVRNNSSRLEEANFHLKAFTEMANVLRRSEEIYKQKLDWRNSDLKMAEAEVDLLGDEVDALLRLLEKIYIALDHYSPILKHYPGIIEILELVRRELIGEYIKS